MTRHKKLASKAADLQAMEASSMEALQSYTHTLDFLGRRGESLRKQHLSKPDELPFLKSVTGIQNLYLSLNAAASAVPGAADEEWNPLSQRPHAPVPPVIGQEMGAAITALKEAVDAFTTLTHEMMHVALWEPFFAGRWKPGNRRVFSQFSLLAEGYCFYFSDIVVSGAVRVRLPDGEFALERQTPSNARFHPIRAFHALGIHDLEEILSIYLDGFEGQSTKLWQPRGVNDFAAALAAQTYDFYVGSLKYLDDVYRALASFGTMTEFYRNFCAIEGLPSFLDGSDVSTLHDKNLKSYFVRFSRLGLDKLARLSSSQIASIRWRRMLQMRAYYALQVRWLLKSELVLGQRHSVLRHRNVVKHVESYLKNLKGLLKQLAKEPETSPEDSLQKLDAHYDEQVRVYFLTNNYWVGHRWLIAPRRAGGHVNVFGKAFTSLRDAKVASLQIVAFLVDELTRSMRESKTIETRAVALGHIQRIATLGKAIGEGDNVRVYKAIAQLNKELSRSHLLPIWSVPLASFDPAHNQYRELVFSYQ